MRQSSYEKDGERRYSTDLLTYQVECVASPRRIETEAQAPAAPAAETSPVAKPARSRKKAA